MRDEGRRGGMRSFRIVQSSPSEGMINQLNKCLFLHFIEQEN